MSNGRRILSGMPGSRLACALAASVLLLTPGCTTAEEPAPAAGASASSDDPANPLPSYDTTTVSLERAPFCDLLGDTAVRDALGGEPDSSKQYGNGDRTRLAPGVEDVAHEVGCVHQRDGEVARAWLFVPPVTPARARALVQEARTSPGCATDAGAPAYGAPSVALLCTGKGTATASYRGLFGDAWLACSLSVPLPGLDRPALFERTGRWCAEVAQAAAAD